MLGDLLAELDLIRRHVEERHLALGKRVGHAADDRVAQLPFDLGDRVRFPRVPLTLVWNARGSLQAPRVDAEGAQPDRAELLVADRDRVARCPSADSLCRRVEKK